MTKVGSCVSCLGAVLSLTLVLLAVVGWVGLVFPFWGWPFYTGLEANVPLTPSWALECWLWEDDVNTADEVLRLLEGYEEHDIPVRTLLIDSPWSDRYNDFKIDETRYPNPEAFFGGLESRGYRVVLWMTTMVNSRNKDTRVKASSDWYEEARGKGYLAGNGSQVGWWKGKGGFIDYTNPEAVAWWQSMQERVLHLGVDGWKLDGTATLFRQKWMFLPIFYMKTRRGILSTRDYMNLYYRTEYRHGLETNPEFITLVRSVDGLWTHPEGFAPLDAAPVTWVGDQDHAWSTENEGIEEAIRYILKAAELGYCIIGSDVGGYSGGSIPAHLYIRWAEFSAFCGLFLNGGHGNRALWERTQEELEIIRRFSWLHTELVPYIYSYMVECHEGGPPLMRPMGEGYQYLLGDYFLVAPIYRDSDERTVHLPRGKWRYFFDDRELLSGPTTVRRTYPRDEYPVFVKEGSVVPMEVRRSYTGFGDEDSEGYLTLLVYPAEEAHYRFRLPDQTDVLQVHVRPGSGLSINLEHVPKPQRLRILSGVKPREVWVGGKPIEDPNRWWYEKEKNLLWIQNETLGSVEINIVYGNKTNETD